MYTKPMYEKREHENERRAGKCTWESLEVETKRRNVAIK